MSPRIKNLLYAIIVIGLFAPLAQQMFNIPQPGLKGAFLPTEKPQLTWNSWFEGSWQQKYSDYYETTFGFRPWLIKIRNHIEFNLFRKVHSGIIVGKEDYLYERDYIDGFLGVDRMPLDSATFQIQKLAYIQQYLLKKNKHLLTVLAPGKASFYPEYIPDELHPEKRSITNYHQISFLLRHSVIPHIDFNKWFLSIKDTSSNLLFSKFGIHWTAYSTKDVTDSIVRKMESLSGNHWGEYTWGPIRKTKTPLDSDDDVMQVINTMGTSSGDTYSYVDIEFLPTGKRPKVLIIGDSFVWTLINHGAIMRSMADSSQYLYYNHDIYSFAGDGFTLLGTKEKIAVPEKLESFDYIILCNTEPNYRKLGNGFIDAYYKQLTGTDIAPTHYLR